MHLKRQGNQLAIESRGVGVGAESPEPSSPKLTKSLSKLSLESQNISQMIESNNNWFSKSQMESDADDCQSVDSVGTDEAPERGSQ